MMRTQKQADYHAAPQLNFKLNEAIDILSRTPALLEELLSGLSTDRMRSNEGGKSWSPHENLAHLLFGEQTDWMPRVRLFMQSNGDLHWEPFDMQGHHTLAEDCSTAELLYQFRKWRKEGLDELQSMSIGASELKKTCIHADLGKVTLRNHLSAWVVHDLGHIAQVSRVMAKHYYSEVGPWVQNMTVLSDRPQ